MSNPFLQAVRDGDLMAAKTAFNQEMSARVSTTITTMRQEVANSVPLPDAPVSFEVSDE